jgi:glycoprotein endo-alpha-1,2-mannosidase
MSSAPRDTYKKTAASLSGRCCALVLAAFAASAGAEDERARRDDVLAFFYLWYGTPLVDGKWSHWDHQVLEHWTPEVRAKHSASAGVKFKPPHDIHAPFYPERGPYSSRDGAVMRAQFAEMRSAGISTAVISWWGRPDGSSAGDSQGVLTDGLVPGVLDAAAEAGVTVALHLEPYAGRSAESVALDLKYLCERYFSHGAVARDARTGRPLLFVYDSYHIAAEGWARLLKRGGDLSAAVRGAARAAEGASAGAGADAGAGAGAAAAPCDAHFIGLWLNAGDGRDLRDGGFDGAYSYFATDSFSHGSSPSNWPAMATFLRQSGMDFLPSVSPGYDDSKIRPWNAQNKRARRDGGYYRDLWDAAIASGADRVTITSFNEWGEGTQIEPAVSRFIDVGALAPRGGALDRDLRQSMGLPDRYDDYLPGGPSLYLDITREYAEKFREAARARRAEEEALLRDIYSGKTRGWQEPPPHGHEL